MAEAAEAPALELSDVLIEEIRAALMEGNATLAAGLATPLHPADLADLLEQLESEERAPLIAALGPSFDPEAIAYLDEFVRREVIEALGPEAAGRVVAELESDDAVDILSGLDAAFQLQVLGALPSTERTAIEQGLAFPEDSAGRLMRRELVAVPDYWNAGQAIDYLRGHPGLPDEFYDIILVDPRFRPVAAVPLSNLLRSVRDTSLRAVEQKGLRTFAPDTDQEEVGRAFRKYGLVSAPVVAADGRLLGVITVDDVVEVIEEEAEEDILKLGGVQEVDVLLPVLTTQRRRLPWLVVNLASSSLAALVISGFAGEIEQVVALAVLMPMVAALGGNSGTQALTVMVRSLAMREITGRTAWRAVTKELTVGLLNGGVLLVVGSALALAWFGSGALALLFGAAMLTNVATGALAGALIPIVLSRIGLDPAVASGVFLTTVTDCVGFFVFLGLAALVLL